MKKYVAFLVTLLLIVGWAGVASADLGGGSGSLNITMNASCSRVWQWDIQKTATPDWNIFTNDEAISQYIVTLTKKGYQDSLSPVSGTVNISNKDTVNSLLVNKLIITLYADTGSGMVAVPGCQSTQSIPVVGPSASVNYSYSFSPGAGYDVNTKFMVTANLMNGKNTVDTESNTPATPAVIQSYDTVHVTDSWKGDLGAFSDSAVIPYTRTFHAGESGTFDNIATITETGQSAKATVKVQRYDLSISKTAVGSYDRKYTWTIDKVGDQTALKVAPGQTVPVNYKVTVTATPTDTNFKASGVVTISNSSPIDATINSVADIITAGNITVPLNTAGITFPYTLKSGATLTLPYSIALPDKTARTNTATAVQQNYRYSYDGSVTKLTATTSQSANAGISFGNPTTTIDGSATVVDDLKGTLGTVLATASPAVFNYPLNFSLTSVSGGYKVVVSKAVTSCENTNWKVTNTATLTTCDTHTVLKDSWTVTITKGTFIGTYTIGYWKNHSCEVSKLLPIYLGTQGGCKTIKIASTCDATKYLSYGEGSPSNGIVKLYAQLLAAKLNIKNGADGSAVASTISAADAFLAKNNLNSWAGLDSQTKNTVIGWASKLDDYNNGVIGPGHAG